MTNHFFFDPMARLKLEVERDPVAGEYLNKVPNPTGLLGGWGWTTPTNGASLGRWDYDAGAPSIQYTTIGGFSNIFLTTPFPVAPGNQVRGAWVLRDAPVAGFKATFFFYNADGTTNSTVSDNVPTSSGTNGTQMTTARTIPAGAYFAALAFEVTKGDYTHPYPSTGSAFAVREVRVFMTGNAISISDASMTANLGAPTTLWTNILGSAYNDIDIQRDEFDLGTMTAVIRNAALDPATASTLRPGRKIRLTALSGATSGTFEPLFTGEIQGDVDVSYDIPRRRVSDPKHVRIALTAVDAMNDLTGIRRRYSVDTVAQLPWMLENESTFTAGVAIPWDCDGVSGHVASATYRAVNDNASAADQVALTRDSVSGYAWFDRYGILRVRTTLPTPAALLIDENVYSSIDLGFNASRIINSLDIKLLNWSYTDNDMTESLTEARVAGSSIATWGRRHRTFTMLATTYLNRGGLNAVASQVFAANATPKIAPRSVRLPIRTDAHRVARAFVELYDRHQVKNTSKGIDEIQRVTSIRHRITPDGWLVDIGYAGQATIPVPQRQPELGRVA